MSEREQSGTETEMDAMDELDQAAAQVAASVTDGTEATAEPADGEVTDRTKRAPKGESNGDEPTDATEGEDSDGTGKPDAGAADGKPDGDLLTAKDVPDWTPDQREYLNGKFREKLGPYVKRAKEAAEKLAAAEQELTEAKRVTHNDWRHAIAQQGIPPELVDETEAGVLREYQQARAYVQQCRKHVRDGWAKGEDGAERDYEPGEVEQALARWEEQADRLAGRAAAIRERVTTEIIEAVRAKRAGASKPKAAGVKAVALPPPPVKPRTAERRGQTSGLSARGGSARKSAFDAKAAEAAGDDNAMEAYAASVADEVVRRGEDD